MSKKLTPASAAAAMQSRAAPVSSWVSKDTQEPNERRRPDGAAALGDWMVALGKPLAVGLVALASTLAVIGYVAVQIGWRMYVVSAWRSRARRRRKG